MTAASQAPVAKWFLAALLAGLYVILLSHFGGLLYQDYPNHLARATVIADLLFHHGQHFGAAFQFTLMPYTYLAGDVLLASFVQLFGPEGATWLWTALAVLSLPCAVLFYLRATRAPANSHVFLFLFALYLSCDWFFFLGFVNFRFSIALTIVALAVAQQQRREHSLRRWLGYCALIAFGYLTHLAFLVFAGAAIGATGLFHLWRRKTALLVEIGLLLPIGLAMAWQLAVHWVYPTTREIIIGKPWWGTLAWKLRRLDWNFIRFNERVDVVLAAAFLLLLLWTVLRPLRLRTALQPDNLEMPLLIVVFVGLFLVFPLDYGDPGYLDVRALPFLAIFAALWCVSLASTSPAISDMGSPLALGGITVLLAANLYYLCGQLAIDHAWLTRYRYLLDSVPATARVLPVYTHEFGIYRFAQAHAGTYVVTDRKAFVPNLFAGDQGQPMKYFRYRNHPYAPSDYWYSRNRGEKVDWHAIACNYNLLLVMKPYESARLALPLTLVAENSSAALLAPVNDQSTCRSQ
jgi:hypothetical protein